MRVLPCGDTAVLVEVSTLDQVLALHAALLLDPPTGVVEVVPAARTVLLRVDPRVTDVDAVARAVGRTTPLSAGRTEAGHVAAGHVAAGHVAAGHVELGVVYDGPDLEEVGRLTGLGPRGVVAAHVGQVWTVAFSGFAPGFGYLVGQDDRLQVPRRADPRTRVPAGAVALAGEFSGVYPRASPGGWQLLGSCDAVLWDVDRAPPALFVPGTSVRFRELPAGPA